MSNTPHTLNTNTDDKASNASKPTEVETVKAEDTTQTTPSPAIKKEDILKSIQETNRVIHGFSIDTVTKAPLQLAQYAILNASQQEVFDLVSDHEGMAQYTFSLAKVSFDDSKAKTPCGEGTKRFCSTPVGFVIEEKIVCWQPPKMYGYAVLNVESVLPNHLGVVQIEALDDKRTLLMWRTYFHGRLVGGIFARAALGAVLPDMVANFAKQFQGKVLKRNAVHQLVKDL